MAPITIPAADDEHELLELIHCCGCYDGNKSRLYRDALREGLKALAVKHDLSVMVKRLPANELLAQAFAPKKDGEVQP